MIERKKWFQSKTIWTGIAGLVATAGALFTGEMELASALQAGLTSLIGIFLRQPMLEK
jgi:hypothetical protein